MTCDIAFKKNKMSTVLVVFPANLAKLPAKSYVSGVQSYTTTQTSIHWKLGLISNSHLSIFVLPSSFFQYERDKPHLLHVPPLPALCYIEERTHASSFHQLFHALSSPTNGAPA
jgi:hypothetical protein